MIKWTTRLNGRAIIWLGLEAGNVAYLQAGRPILIDGAALGLPVDIVIHYGETKELMIQQMREAGMTLPPEKDWRT